MTQDAASITALPTAERKGATAGGAASIAANAPRPEKSGAAYAQRRPNATARSRLITVPKKPDAMSGPWIGASDAPGDAQPSRARPASMPRNNEAKASR